LLLRAKNLLFRAKRAAHNKGKVVTNLLRTPISRISAEVNLGRARGHYRDQSNSSARFIAGWLRSLTLIQCFDLPLLIGPVALE
jgi:hypothetical protein